MWTLINSVDILQDIKPGNIIARDPDLPNTFHIVRMITPNFIKAANKATGNVLDILPQSLVIDGKWWVQNEGPVKEI